MTDKAFPSGLTDAERAVAAQPGMYGRINFGQGNCFDEAYQIMMDSFGMMHHSSHVCTMVVMAVIYICIYIYTYIYIPM